MLRLSIGHALIVACFTFFYSCAPSEESFSVFRKINDPEGKYQVIIEQAPSSFIPRGPSTIKVYVAELKTGERTCLITTRIANDGIGLSASNIKSCWENAETLSLCFSGIEQADYAMEIDMKTLKYTEIHGNCDCTD